jgi:hypothetical protein
LFPHHGGIRKAQGAESATSHYFTLAWLFSLNDRPEHPKPLSRSPARFLNDQLEGADMRLCEGIDTVKAAKVVSAILAPTHRHTEDYVVTIPADLPQQPKRRQAIFMDVVVAIGAISLIADGIGITKIVLTTMIERTREIGIRRAIGARAATLCGSFSLRVS